MDIKDLHIRNKDITDSLKRKFSPEESDLRKAQMGMLELLKFLDRICEEHGLTYWLDFGTLLGAVRHGGFIPWDDDIDVCMPTEDALKLKALMSDNVFEGHIVLQNADTDPNYQHIAWMTLRDTRIEYIQDSPAHNRLKFKGLQVDIFHIEKGVPEIPKFIIKALMLLTVYHPLEEGNILSFARPFANMSRKFIDKCLVPLGRLFNTKSTVYNYGLGNPFQIHQPEKVIFPLGKIRFEGVEFNCPNDCDAYLVNHYGDWRKIPEESQIETHEVKFRTID